MGGINYYHLAKDEKPPDEFCAVRDMGGEPGEYMFYVPEAENAKLRELCADLYAEMITYSDAPNYNASVWAPKLRELGIEVPT